MHLEKILVRTRQDVAERKQRQPLSALESLAAAHQPRGFAAALRKRAKHGPAVIAELKKASPSKGLIRDGFDVGALAIGLASGGAAALSVLTEEHFFLGSLRNLEIASDVTPLPCLRKDFILDEFQILEARAHGADAILLIAAALNDQQLQSLTRAAHGYELDVLCEVHTQAELDRVGALGCDAYGVNNRNLHTFDITLDTSLALAERLPAGAVHVAESGIHTAEDLNLLRNAGYHAFLIGESLMRKPDPGKALGRLIFESLEAQSALAAKGN